MWAKLRGYPAWPAQVLSVYAGHEAPPQPRPGCVLVHFFGTYDIQWLDNEKKARNRVGGHCDGAMADALSGPQVSPFRDNFEQNAAASKQKARSQHALQACTTLSCESDKPFIPMRSRSSKPWRRRSTSRPRAAQRAASCQPA